MRTKRRNTASAVAAVALLALVLGSQPAARAGSDSPQPSGPSEGIKVHGDWTIEIRNPDGTVASRHVFKNALVPGGGDTALARLLGRTLAPFHWRVSHRRLLWDRVVPVLPGAATPPDGFPCVVTEPATDGHGYSRGNSPAVRNGHGTARSVGRRRRDGAPGPEHPDPVGAVHTEAALVSHPGGRRPDHPGHGRLELLRGS